MPCWMKQIKKHLRGLVLAKQKTKKKKTRAKRKKKKSANKVNV